MLLLLLLQWAFSIHWPHESYLGAAESLTLAFDTKEKAGGSFTAAPC